MTQLVGDHEGSAERILDTWRHADLAFERLVATLGFGFDLPFEVIDLDLELPQDGIDHVAVGQRQQQVFGIDFGAPELCSVSGGLLQ